MFILEMWGERENKDAQEFKCERPFRVIEHIADASPGRQMARAQGQEIAALASLVLTPLTCQPLFWATGLLGGPCKDWCLGQSHQASCRLVSRTPHANLA